MESLQGRIDRYLESAAEKGFAGAILVALNPEEVISRGYGWSDRANRIRVTPSTVFNIGGLTQHFTIAAVLVLMEQGRLQLSDQLSRFFPDTPADKAPITLEQILLHEAGLSPQAGSYRYDFVSREQFLRELFREPLVKSSGPAHATAGYVLLAAVVEQVSGQTFEGFLAESLFQPLGMRQTGYVLPRWDRARVAHSYFYDIHGEAWVDWGTTSQQFGPEGVSWYAIGKGDMQSTLEDLYTWQLALQRGSILTPRTRELLEAYLLLQEPAATSYHVEASNGHFHAELLRDVEHGFLVIMLSSLDREVPIAAHVGNMVKDETFQPPPFTVDPYALLITFIRTHSPDQIQELIAWLEQHGSPALDDPGLLHPVGLMQMNKGEHQWAIALLELNTRLFPAEGNFWDSLGEAYLAGGQVQAAVRSFQEALRWAPSTDCFWCANAQMRLEALAR